MNKIGNVTFGKLDVRFLLENISLLAAQDSVHILFVQMSAGVLCQTVYLLRFRTTAGKYRKKCIFKVTELSCYTDKESLNGKCSF